MKPHIHTEAPGPASGVRDPVDPMDTRPLTDPIAFAELLLNVVCAAGSVAGLTDDDRAWAREQYSEVRRRAAAIRARLAPPDPTSPAVADLRALDRAALTAELAYLQTNHDVQRPGIPLARPPRPLMICK